MNAKTSTAVDTTEYVATWGQPRGKGYWTFRIGARRDPYHYYGTYTECRAKAIRAAGALGTTKIWLLP